MWLVWFAHLVFVWDFSVPWWRWWDSNPWPPACRAGALPAELHPHLQWFVVSPFFRTWERFYPFPLSCVGIELSSRTVARKVFSPLQSLTSVFGMGTGGPSAFVTPTKHQSFCSSALISRILDPWKLNNTLSVSRLVFSQTLRNSVFWTRYTFSIERRWSSRTFRYGYLVTT